MRRVILMLGAFSVGCGPQVILATADGSTGNGASADDFGTTSGAGVGVDGGRDDDGVVDGGSSGGGVTSVGATGDPGECWLDQDLFKLPENTGIIPADQDGDGVQELWVASNTDNGPGPGATTLYRVDASGTPGPELQLDGFLVALPDVDGDGVLDIFLVELARGVPPIFAWARGHADGTFELPPTPSDLELGANVSGFFDADGDHLADAFSFTSDGTLDLLLGDGAGAFALGSELPLGIDGVGFVTPIEHAVGAGLLQTQAGFGGPGGGGGGPGCSVREYRLVRTADGMLEVLSSTEIASTLFGPMLRAYAQGSGEVAIYTRACDDAGGYLPEIRRLLTSPGSDAMVEAGPITDVTWAAPADLDGDGLLDVALAQPGADTIAWALALDNVTLSDPEPIPVSNPEVRGNNVRAVDLDGDGREELLRGWVSSDGDPAQLTYDRIWLGPCEG